MKVDDMITIVGGATTTVIEMFQANPWNYLYESDLRSLLYARIHDGLIGQDVKIACPLGKGKVISSCPVKTEYPSRDRFDIALIEAGSGCDYQDWARRMHPYEHPNPEVLPWQLPVSVAIELKYHVTGFSLPQLFSGMMADVTKIHDYALRGEKEIAGLALLFMQSKTQQDLLFRTHTNRRLWIEGHLPPMQTGKVLGCIIAPSSNPASKNGERDVFYRWFDAKRTQ